MILSLLPLSAFAETTVINSFKTDANGKAAFKGYINVEEVDDIIMLGNEDALLVYNFGVLGGKKEV